MHGETFNFDSPEYDDKPPDLRQFRLSTAMGLMALASAAFAVARFFGLEEYLGGYVQGFREAPWFSSFNLAIFGCLAWYGACLVRRRILQAVLEWPTNGAFMGTVYGGALFGMSVAYFWVFRENPIGGALAMFFCGLIGAGWAVLPALISRAVVEPFDTEMLSPWRAAAVGAVIGATAGYSSVIMIAFWSPAAFLSFGLLPAFFGGACGAIGAYLQSLVRAGLPHVTREQLERLRSTVYDTQAWNAADARLRRSLRRDAGIPD
jgi:hypothetical protein